MTLRSVGAYPKDATCSHCGRSPVRVRGWCQPCYLRWLKRGTVEYAPRRIPPGCDDPLTLAWCAGLFEGEGSVRINKATTRNLGSLLVDMVNTAEELVAPFAEMWGGYFRSYTATSPRKGYWRWRAASTQAAGFLRDVQPYLRSAKYQERARLGLEYQAQKVTGPDCRTPEYAARQREFYDRMTVLNVRGCA